MKRVLTEWYNLRVLDDRIDKLPSGDIANECTQIRSTIHNTILRCVGMLSREQNIEKQLEHIEALHGVANNLIDEIIREPAQDE